MASVCLSHVPTLVALNFHYKMVQEVMKAEPVTLLPLPCHLANCSQRGASGDSEDAVPMPWNTRPGYTELLSQIQVLQLLVQMCHSDRSGPKPNASRVHTKVDIQDLKALVDEMGLVLLSHALKCCVKRA